jgi:peptide deformylase
MGIKRTAQIGEEVVRQKSVAVKDVSTREIKQIIKDLVDSMRHTNLVGMAAPQIGKNLRIFVSEIRRTTYRKNLSKSDSFKVFINPRIVWRSKEQTTGYEGCGSVVAARLFGSVKRPWSVICEALDKDGKRFKIKATGLLARVIQHENDHLNGIVFIDRVSDTKTLISRETYISAQKK